MKTVDELLELEEDTLRFYVDKMPELDDQGDSGGFWANLTQELQGCISQLSDDDPSYVQEALHKVKGEIHAFRFYLELMDFPADSLPDPWKHLTELEVFAYKAELSNPTSIEELKKAIETAASKDALDKFSDDFEDYTLNRGLQKATKNKKIKRVEDLQKAIGEAEKFLEFKKSEESDGNRSQKIDLIEQLLAKQKGCCKSAASVLTLTAYDLKSLVELPDATLDAMDATLRATGDKGDWDTLVNKCIKQLAVYETSKGTTEEAAKKEELLGTIKALKLIMILNGQTYITSGIIFNLEVLENNIQDGKEISFGQKNRLSNLKSAIFNAHEYMGLKNLTNSEGEDSKKGEERKNREKQNLSGMLDDLKTSSEHLSELFSQPDKGRNVSAEKLKKIQSIMDIQQAKIQGAMAVVGGTPVVAPTEPVVKKEVPLITKDKGLLEDLTADEWRIVQKIVEDNKNKVPQSYKIEKKQHAGLKHSFIVVDGIPYAIALKQYLGKGGFGKVKVVQTESGNNFAVKVEITTKEDREKKHADIGTERKILNELGKLHGSFAREKIDRKTDDLAMKEYSIMTLELGADVFTRCLDTTRRLVDSEKESRYKIAIGCLDAVKVLHDKGIVHRDIKPENFMMNVSDGVVMISPIDFGLSRRLKQGELTGKEGTGGTPGYVAPEMVDDVFSYATDVYALGKMLNDNFGISIPEMYAKNPVDRPDIKDVLEYLKTQDKKLETKAPEIPSFAAWKKAQEKKEIAAYLEIQAQKMEANKPPLPPFADWKKELKRAGRSADVAPIMHLRALQEELSSKTPADEKPENVEPVIQFHEGVSWKKIREEKPENAGPVIHVQEKTKPKRD
ncbi:MAG TPA: protein kinase [Gammaproteobacteria bacterium]|nr:protein kinase [Gammaproteobacteria bacterium]